MPYFDPRDDTWHLDQITVYANSFFDGYGAAEAGSANSAGYGGIGYGFALPDGTFSYRPIFSQAGYDFAPSIRGAYFSQKDYNISKFQPTNINVSARSISIPLSQSRPNGSSGSLVEAKIITDDQMNKFYMLSTKEESITAEQVARIYDIDPNDVTHSYTENTTICYVSNPNCTVANVMLALQRQPTPTSFFKLGVT